MTITQQAPAGGALDHTNDPEGNSGVAGDIIAGINAALAGGKTYAEATRLVMDEVIGYFEECGSQRDSRTLIAGYVLSVAKFHRGVLDKSGVTVR